ncbi:MAG: PIN domain-containing protein [Lacipirellulaceae bacterium]
MPLYLFDTNVASLSTRKEADPRDVARFERIVESGALAATTHCELLYGIERLPPGQRRDSLREVLETLLARGVPVLPYDRIAAEWHAAERARLAALGATPPFADGQIAAVAAVNQLTLVTRNAADFAGFVGLRVEGW